eukprot:2744034-Prymnesium_polylepis.2
MGCKHAECVNVLRQPLRIPRFDGFDGLGKIWGRSLWERGLGERRNTDATSQRRYQASGTYIALDPPRAPLRGCVSAYNIANDQAVESVPTSKAPRHGDVPTATSSSSAGRGAMPPPTAHCALPTTAGCCAHCLPTLCPADPLHHTRFAAKRASTSACCRSSASC